MIKFFRTISFLTSLIFLLSFLLSTHKFGVGFQDIGFASAIIFDRSDDGELEEGRSESETRNKKGHFFENSSTLEDVWSELKQLLPRRGTQGYIQPKPNIIADFERIVLDMMMIGQGWYENDDKDMLVRDDYTLEFQTTRKNPPTSCNLINLRSLKGMYRVGNFVDMENGRSYCILATTSIMYPWGNVIVDLDASSRTKNLSFDCPHPLFDAETGEQGIRLLKGTTARSWIVAGSHRMANDQTFGSCQPKYSHYSSDVAHSVDNCFMAAVAAVKFYYESVVHQDYTSIQLHGMGKTSCGSIDTFFSHGSCSKSGKLQLHQLDSSEEKIEILQRIARAHPSDNGEHAIATSDSVSSACKLCGSTNTQGRLINGVARNNLCNSFASSYNGRFIQIEQKRAYRRDTFAQFWNDVFNEAYPLFSTNAVASARESIGCIDDLNDKTFVDDNEFCTTDR